MNSAKIEFPPTNFKLLQKLEDFFVYYAPTVERFPVRERFALQAQTKNHIDEMIKLSIRIMKDKNPMVKFRFLASIDRGLEFLRMLVRRAYFRKYINTDKLKKVSEKTNELGKIIGGLVNRYKPSDY